MKHRAPAIHKRYHLLVLVLLFVGAMGHRMVYLGSFPPPLATPDEYHYFWAGMSMLNGEAPRSWSYLDVDPETVLGSFPINGRMCPVVQPAFDHPPLFSFLAGVTGRLFGARPVEVALQNPAASIILWDIWLGKLRILPLICFAISFWLLWFLGRITVGRSATLCGLGFFAVLNFFAVHQRLVVPDTLLAPLALGAFLALEAWRRGRLSSRWAGAVVILLLISSTLTKIIGVSLAAGIIAWATIALRKNRSALWRVWRWSAAGTLLGITSVLFFGWLWGFDYFLQTTKSQGARFTSLDGLFEVISQQGWLTDPGFSPWLISAWILCFLAVIKGPGPFQALVFGYLGIAAAYAFFGSDRLFGWYFLTFCPLLALGLGWGVKMVWTAPDSKLSLIIMLLLLGSCSTAWMEDFESVRTWGRYLYVVLTALIFLSWSADWKTGYRAKLIRGMLVALLLIGFSGEIQKHVRMEIAFRKLLKEEPARVLP